MPTQAKSVQPSSVLQSVNAVTVLDYAKGLMDMGVRKPGHLCNIALATLKHLMLHSESDSLRLQACRTILELGPVQQRLGAMTSRSERHYTPERGGYHQHVHVDSSSPLAQKLTEMLKAGDEAEVMEVLAENSDDSAAK